MSDLLTIPLSRLGRGPISRSVRIEDTSSQFGELPAGVGPIDVDVVVRSDAAGGVRAEGAARTELELECRRCLRPRTRPLTFDFRFWYRPPSDVAPGDEGVWPLELRANEVDLTEALREEFWIATPEFVECEPACLGLCSRCGARLQDEACSCPPPEPDPRWAALRQREPE